MSDVLLLYVDKVKQNIVLQRYLSDFCQRNNVEYVEVTQEDILLGGVLEENPRALLVMPGGESKIYSKQLGKKGQESIRSFIQKGGKYLGICAGAALGAQQIDWHDTLHGEKIDTRTTHKEFTPFGLINVIARGPMVELVKDTMFQTNSYLSIVKLELLLPDRKKMDAPVPYMAGLSFDGITELVDKDKDVSILANMTNGKGIKIPAIVEKEQGLGRVILSIVHFEISGDDLVDDKFFYHSQFNENKKNLRHHLHDCSQQLEPYKQFSLNVGDAILVHALSDISTSQNKTKFSM